MDWCISCRSGIGGACQKRQSAPKNEPQRLIETPNGKGKQVHSGSDNLILLQNGTADHEKVGSSSTPDSNESRLGTLNGGRNKVSTPPQDVSSANGFTNNHENAGLKNVGIVADFFSFDNGGPIIGKNSDLWTRRDFKEEFGPNKRVLRVESIDRRVFSLSGSDGKAKKIKATLVKISDDETGLKFRVVSALQFRLNDKDISYILFAFAKDIEALKNLINSNGQSLVGFTLNSINANAGLKSQRGMVTSEIPSKIDRVFQYEAGCFNGFE